MSGFDLDTRTMTLDADTALGERRQFLFDLRRFVATAPLTLVCSVCNETVAVDDVAAAIAASSAHLHEPAATTEAEAEPLEDDPHEADAEGARAGGG